MNHQAFAVPESIVKDDLTGERLRLYRKEVCESITDAERFFLPALVSRALYGEDHPSEELVKNAIRHLDRMRVSEAASFALVYLAKTEHAIPDPQIGSPDWLEAIRKAAAMRAAGNDLRLAIESINHMAQMAESDALKAVA